MEENKTENKKSEYPIIPVREGVELRMRNLEEARDVFALVDKNRSYLREWLPWVDATKSVKNSRKYIESCLEGFRKKEIADFGIFVRGKLVGSIGLNKIDLKTGTADIGYWIDEDYSGKGIVPDSVQAITEYAFKDLNLSKLTIHCAKENVRSCSIPKKLGFKHEQTLPQHEKLHDRTVDAEVYVLSKEEWENRKTEPSQ